MYRANNPVMCVDPNGMLVGDFIDEKGNIFGNDGQECS